MAKGTLSFNLPEEREEFELAQKAGSYSCVLWALDQEFYRANIKYGLKPEVKQAVIEEMYEELQKKAALMDQEDLDAIILSVMQVCRTQIHKAAEEYEVSVG